LFSPLLQLSPFIRAAGTLVLPCSIANASAALALSRFSALGPHFFAVCLTISFGIDRIHIRSPIHDIMSKAVFLAYNPKRGEYPSPDRLSPLGSGYLHTA
jgi:hypothetical protein